MQQITSPTTSTRYACPTASMPADPEAHPHRDAVFESFPHQFPIAEARCATTCESWEWVPNREAAVVPDPMAALCRRCPARSDCLVWALAGSEMGYWAGTTTNQRERLDADGLTNVNDADRIREADVRASTSAPIHPLGDGSLRWYRREKCRCVECRGHNAAARANERARSQPSDGGAAAAA